ncbi:hypothetical protein [Streptosporangium sp. 'caverna']|uniref:hypothetical protein n=1 Tax=Streptosporangium sp. 'caverna' TaxID=2202249 RepID=UPI000D7E58E9|nr:hypothetical protein [Streptosporangium sp. 'caverna']AWS41653.1 hypothetical protein DKM19_10115 [Streptosporangium sp. 'caverna']
MSFGTYARRVRDQALPYGRRYTSLRCAVGHYKPLGFNATWNHITSRAGQVRTDEAALLRALDILETSREARLAEMAAFALRRKAEREYVVEIVSDIHRALEDLNRPGSAVHAAYGRFLADNPNFLTTTGQRVISYWSCYHRSAYPRLREYPGHLLVSALRAASARS